MKESIVIVATSLLLFSCSGTQEHAETSAVQAPSVEGQPVHNSKKKVGIGHVYAGPNLMGFTLRNVETLGITPTQNGNLSEWRAEHGPLIAQRSKAIAALEGEIKTLSTTKGLLEDVLAKVEQVNTVRIEIATIKQSCQNNLKEQLDADQWQKMIGMYKVETPFVRRAGMDALTHVSPVPNYMSAIKGGAFSLTEAQEASFNAWTEESQPKVAQLTEQVIALEETLYNDALAASPLETILETMKAIEAARVQIVTTKNLGRDNVIEQLDEAQWQTLVSSL